MDHTTQLRIAEILRLLSAEDDAEFDPELATELLELVPPSGKRFERIRINFPKWNFGGSFFGLTNTGQNATINDGKGERVSLRQKWLWAGKYALIRRDKKSQKDRFVETRFTHDQAWSILYWGGKPYLMYKARVSDALNVLGAYVFTSRQVSWKEPRGGRPKPPQTWRGRLVGKLESIMEWAEKTKKEMEELEKK